MTDTQQAEPEPEPEHAAVSPARNIRDRPGAQLNGSSVCCVRWLTSNRGEHEPSCPEAS